MIVIQRQIKWFEGMNAWEYLANISIVNIWMMPLFSVHAGIILDDFSLFCANSLTGQMTLLMDLGVPKVIYYNPVDIDDLMIFWIFLIWTMDLVYTRENHTQMHIHLESSNKHGF